jgi:hypothetical protein
MNINFRKFLSESEEKANVKKTIAKLPAGHQELLRGYKFRYQGGNTLKGDDENIGYIYQDRIVVAAPWNYGREFTTLHEIAHLVYEYKMTKQLKKEWEELVNRTKEQQVKLVKKKGKSADALNQNAEELFSMAYANTYAGTQVVKYDHPEWIEFIKTRVPK